jgi:demethylmenaquinone methyltransferase / 2-methoxy-6-polyprenyl-1,4-benzoquinol methylase
MTRAQLDRKPAEVSAMFDKVADRYDLLNDVLSLGQDRYWRTMVARAVGARPGELVLDLAAGTGTSSRTFTRTGGRCVACDFSLGMLRVGAQRPAASVRFVAGDALDLPFADQAFDAVTISFGLRNVADTGAALTEMLRVTRPGGRLVICEFSHLRPAVVDTLYGEYLSRALPAVARRLSGNAEAYDYLAESIKDWPAQQDLAGLITDAGWGGARWLNLSFGVVALHLARRPAQKADAAS